MGAGLCVLAGVFHRGRHGTAVLRVCFGWFVPTDFYMVPCSVLLFLGMA